MAQKRLCLSSLLPILVPRAHNPSGLWQGSRELSIPATGQKDRELWGRECILPHSGLFVSDTSPKSIDHEGLGESRTGTRQFPSSLQVLQNKAAKIILDRPLYSSASHALVTLKWIPLEKRHFQRRCVHVYKCLNGLINHELTLVTQQHQHNYNTRNKVSLRLH